jgi:hypothetical protein
LRANARIIAIITLSVAVSASGRYAAGQAPDAQAPADATPARPSTAFRDRQPGLAQAALMLQDLGKAQVEAQAAGGSEVAQLKQQIELLQKQIDVLQKMTQLLADQVKKQSTEPAAVETLQEQTATLEARSRQAAQRDLEQAQAHDMLVEQIDAQARTGPDLPATLRELFSPCATTNRR